MVLGSNGWNTPGGDPKDFKVLFCALFAVASLFVSFEMQIVKSEFSELTLFDLQEV